MVPRGLRLHAKDPQSPMSRPSRFSVGGSPNAHSFPSDKEDESLPRSPRFIAHGSSYHANSGTTVWPGSGSPGASRRGTPPLSPRMLATTISGGEKAAMTRRDHVRRDCGDTRVSESPEGDRVRSATRGDRKFGSSTGSEARAIAEVSGDSGRVRVAVRVRPISEKEKLAGAHNVISMTGNQTRIIDPAYFDSGDGSESPKDRSMWERTFKFDHSFWTRSPRGEYKGVVSAGTYSGQADVHQKLGGFLLDNACKGFNCSLFAYGQTGSGKTYTMLGDSSDLTTAAGPGEAGLIPRICIELFQRLGLTNAERGCSISSCRSGQASIQVSFCEIYNEQVRDLFAQAGGNSQGLRVREHPSKGAFVEGLSVRPVICYQQVQRLLDVGMSARATAATAMNEISSRSHAIFTITIAVTATTKLNGGGGKQTEDEEGDPEEDVSVRTSKICLVDLAGSERANSTGAKGDRLREASNINKSLSTLGDVIKALAKRTEPGRGSIGNAGGGSENFVPYRNSMLTWLLKDSIGGNSKTVMLAAISPVAEAYQETMSTLRYVERAKDIVNTTTINDASSNPLIGKLREEVRVLQEMLKCKDALIIQHEENEAMLSAALKREHAEDGEKMQTALNTADNLQAALDDVTRKTAEVAAAAATASFESAATTERLHREELKTLTENHLVEIEALRENYRKEMRAREEENSVRYAEGTEAIRDQAVVERATSKRKWDDELLAERAAVEQQHSRALSQLQESHKDLIQRMATEAAEAAADAVAAADVEAHLKIATLNKQHAVDIAERCAAAEAQMMNELIRLRQELEDEKANALAEASASADAQNATVTKEAVAKADAAASTAAAAAADVSAIEMCKLREEHAEELLRLRGDLEDTARRALYAAVDEERKRMQLDHEEALAAAIEARESALQQEHRDQTKLAQDESFAQIAAARAILNGEHKRELENERVTNAEAFDRGAAEAEQRRIAELFTAEERTKMNIARATLESTRSIEALQEEHLEHVRNIKEAHRQEVTRTLAAKDERREMDLAKALELSTRAIEDVRVEAATELATLTLKHEAEIRHMEQSHATKSALNVQHAIDACEKREASRLAEISEAHAGVLSAAKVGHTSEMVNLQAHHEEAMKHAFIQREAEVARASTLAEERLAAELKAAKCEFAEILAAKRERHQEELRLIKRGNKSDIKDIRATEEARRVAELAAATQEHTNRMDEVNTEHSAMVASVNSKHEEELDRCSRDYENRIESLNAIVAIEREGCKSDAENLEKSHASSFVTLRAEADAAAAAQKAVHQEDMEALKTEHEAEVKQTAEATEKRRLCELAIVREEMVSSVASMERRAVASIAALRDEHARDIVVLKCCYDENAARVASETEEPIASNAIAVSETLPTTNAKLEVESALTALPLKTQDLQELGLAEERRETAVRDPAEAAAAAENTKKEVVEVAVLTKQHSEQLQKLEEYAGQGEVVAACEKDQQWKVVSAAEIQSKILIDAVKAEAAGEMKALEMKYLEEIRKADEEERKRRMVAEAESAATLESLTAKHQEQLRLATDERDKAVRRATSVVETQKKVDLEDLRERLMAMSAEEKGKIEVERDNLAETHGQELSRISEEHENTIQTLMESAGEKRLADLAAASDQFTANLAEIEDQAAAARIKQEEDHRRQLEAERESRAAAVTVVEADREAAETAAEARAMEQLAAVEMDLQARLAVAQKRLTSASSALDASEAAVAATARDHDIERQRQLGVLEEDHKARLNELEESWNKRMAQLLRRTENAEVAAAEAEASADESSTRADALESMLQASVGSRGQELTVHRNRLAQLQAFVCRREKAEQVRNDSSETGSSANRSVEQRVIDLKALVAGVGVGIGSTITGESRPFTFAGEGLGGEPGLTIEQYAEELEAVLVRATAETAAARQDHLETDMQLKSTLRQLVGLKLVHAQLRERLEDTQVKLEHKSQSAARRWLASAQRLAQEFARPDRQSLMSLSPKPRSRTPKAVDSNDGNSRNTERRSKSPARLHRVSSAGATIDFNKTL